MFFQIDDQFQANQKTKTLARKALTGDVRGLAALGIWSTSGSMCQATLTDGVVSIEDLVSITLNHEVSLELANLLVAAGLWHAPGHDCERCPAVHEGTWLFHDWFAMGYDRGYQVKTKREKSKELKDRVLVAAVWARDCADPSDPNTGLCRYCGTTLHKKDTRSADGPQMDHVDPTKAAGVENVALACGPCNRKKAQRTPEAAGMTLRSAPRSQEAAGSVGEGSPGNADAEPSPVSPARAPRHSAVAGTARDVSPGKTDAEMSPVSPPKPGPGKVKAERTSAETTVETSAETVETTVVPDPVPQWKGVLACGGDRAGVGRAGQGRVPDGLRQGSGGVAPAESSDLPKLSRRRRRSKRKGDSPQSSPDQSKPAPPSGAGPAPDAQVAGRFGSPWHGWSGPPSDVTETFCAVHDEEQPCRKCGEAEQ